MYSLTSVRNLNAEFEAESPPYTSLHEVILVRISEFQHQLPPSLLELAKSISAGQAPRRATDLHSWFILVTQGDLGLTPKRKKDYLDILRIWADAQWAEVFSFIHEKRLLSGTELFNLTDDFISITWLAIAQRNLSKEAGLIYLQQLLDAPMGC